MMDIDAEQRTLLDRLACRTLHETYSYAEIVRDADLLADVFTDDGVWGVAHGRDGIRQQMLVSFGLYPTYWMYQNLRLLKGHKQLSISPAWRTFGAFIPLIGLLFFKDQLQLFAETAAADSIAIEFSPWARTLAFTAVSLLGELPNPWWIMATGAVLVLLPVQRALNQYWAIEQPGLPMRQRFSSGEITFLVVCGAVWLLLIFASIADDRLVVALA